MKKIFVLLFILSMITVFSLAGCGGEITSEGTAEGKAAAEEKPDEELFDKYFSHIELGSAGFGPKTHSSAFGGDAEKNICTLLPHQEAWLGVGFKNKKNFKFRIAVLNLETNNFIEKCAATISSEGSDGFGMEALEWAFLRPGSYEYRIYVEGKLAAALPFEVKSYTAYFFGDRGQ